MYMYIKSGQLHKREWSVLIEILALVHIPPPMKNITQYFKNESLFQ